MTSDHFASTFEANPAAKTDEQREAILANPGFGNHFTDHMRYARPSSRSIPTSHAST